MRISDWSSDVCSSDLVATDYLYTALIIPFLCLSRAALGLNILTGYCGQLSLGTGAFMGVGAVAAWNIASRVPDLNLLVVFVLAGLRSEEHTSELQSLMRISYAVFCLKKKKL